MKSGVWKGVAAGLVLFLVIAGVSSLTPLRVPVLKAFGRDYASLQLQKRAAQASGPSSPTVLTPERVEVRLEAWHKRNARLSPFGLLGWFMDVWPWLLGLGLALPALGGLIGAQAGSSPRPSAKLAVDEPDDTSLPKGALTPEVPPRLPQDVPPEAAPPPEVVSPPPVAAPPPKPPEEWNWNAKPAARTTPGRPKPPPVKSPNGDSL